MKKHITQAAIDNVVAMYAEANNLTNDCQFGDEAWVRIAAITDTFAIITGQEYDAARMMLRKRAGII